MTVKRLNKYGFFGMVAGRKPLFSKKNIAPSDLNQPQDVWDNVLWTGEIKMVFSHNAMFGKNQTLHINTNTLSQQLSTVVGA